MGLYQNFLIPAFDARTGQFIFRSEQRDTIDKTLRQFKKGNQMLWNAKMSFGKTLSALQVVKEKVFERTLILTHRPMVDSGGLKTSVRYFMIQQTICMVQRQMESEYIHL